MEQWHVTNGYSYPVEATRDSYFVGPREWEPGRKPYFDQCAVFVKGKELAHFVASAVNLAITEGFTIDGSGAIYFEGTKPYHWRMYTPLPEDCPESRWLCRRGQEDPTEDSDFDFDVTHPVRLRHAEVARFVLFAINYAIEAGHWPEYGAF